MIVETVILPYLAPFVFICMAVTMLVLRASGSRVFFDVVGTFQANRMISDTKASATVMESLFLDSLMGIEEAGAEMAQMFNSLVDATVPLAQEIENARVEFDKFLGDGEDLAEVTAELERIGLGFGFAADEAFRAGARMAQLSGVLGGGTTEVGTEIGMMFGMISGMDTEAAMQRLINLQQQTQFMTDGLEDNMTAQEKVNTLRRDSIAVLDQLNTIENRSAATMQQITFVMNQFASQAHLTNESIAAMAAMSATLIEAGEEQGKGGRALRMIYARLGANTNGARDAIEQLGISVYDTSGDMRPFSDLLEELAEKYDGMNGAQQQALAQNVAGNRHYTRLIKLLENVDRVKELELEAMVQQMSAQDEINRRLESQIFAYEQSEAAIKNYSAAVGNALLPGLTAANNQHALFMSTLAKMLDNDMIGGFVGRLVMMSRVMGNFAGPVFQSVLALKNLQIALQTQQIVQRAFNGEQIASIGNYKELTNSQMASRMASKSLSMELTKEQKEMAKKRQQLVANIAKEGERRVALQGTWQAQGHSTRKLKAHVIALQEHDKIMGASTDAVQVDTIVRDINENAILSQSMALTKYTMSLGAIGSIMMMFAQNEKHMAAGLMITTAAMSIQMYQTYKSLQATMANNAANVSLLGTYIAQLPVMSAINAQLTAIAASSRAATIAVRGLKMGLATLGIGVVIIGLDVLLEKLGVWNALLPDIDQSVEQLNNTVSDTSLVMQYLAMDTSVVVSTLEEKRRKLSEIENSTDEMSKKLAEGYRVEIASLEKTLDMRAVEAIQVDGLASKYDTYLQHQENLDNVYKNQKGSLDNVARGMLKIVDVANSLDVGLEKIANKITGVFDFKLFDAKKDEGFLSNLFSGGLTKERSDAKKGMQDFVDHNADLMTFLEGKTFETSEDMIKALEEYNNYLRNYGKDDLTGGIGSSIAEATEEIHNFNNAREELFFGFSSDKLTGDLVRQVKQQGVETLITSTEVIMHNNFNGMTVPEVADQIIEEIESRGNLRNYNLSTR